MSKEEKVKVKYLGHKTMGKIPQNMICLDGFCGRVEVGDIIELTELNIKEFGCLILERVEKIYKTPVKKEDK